MKRTTERAVASLAMVTVLLGFWASASTHAAPFKVKMATMVPENSPWDKILRDMAKAWQEGSQERVTLDIYPGGVAGDEPDVIRKMRIGQFQSAALSVSGLAEIDDYFKVFEIPMFFGSVQEMVHVLGELTPTLEGRLEQKDFVLLGWGYVGWVYFFTTEPVANLDDLKKLKIFSWAGNEAMVQWWRGNGFRAVPLAATDIVTGLQTGLIEAVSAPPLYAMQVQYYKVAPYMLDIGLVPMMGAMVMTKRAWNRIDETDRRAILTATKAAEQKIVDTIPKLDETAIKLMASQGMTVLELSSSDRAAEFIAVAQRFAATMRGDIVPAEIFDQALAARDAFRKRETAAPTGGESPSSSGDGH